MKVFLTTDTLGGVWTYSVDLAGQLADRGHEVVLAALGGWASPAQTAQVASLPGVQLHSSAWKLEWMDDPWPDVDQSSAWVLGLAAQTRPDVIHLNTLAHGALPWEAPTLLVAHSCVLSWWQAVKGQPAPPAWDTYRTRVTASLRGADAVVAPSAALLEQLTALYGPLPQTSVIYNGGDAANFPPAEKEDFILATGRLWDEAKNMAALARVAHRLPWPVYAAGDAQSPDSRRIDPGGLHLLGHLSGSELATWLGRAAIFVAPARYEPFGLGILEAALAGCALVLGDIASLREIWAGAAIFVPSGDDEALYSAIVGLTQEPGARAELVRLSRTRARDYTAQRMTDRYLDLYRRLLRLHCSVDP
jgi:glycogen(starch) synthase